MSIDICDTNLVLEKTEASPIQRYALNGPTMGTRFSAIFYTKENLDLGTLNAKLQTAVNGIDEQMSPWKPQSALMELNQAPIGHEIHIPNEFAIVLARAQQISANSGGAFDFCLGKITNAWGFGPHKSQPDQEQITALANQNSPSLEAIHFNPTTQRARRQQDIQIDLCGIAKGYGVDVLGDVLEQAGVSNYLVSIDGEMKASGQKPDGQAWMIGVEGPDSGVRNVARVLELSDLAIASSGNYRHQVVIDEKTYSHTFDPRTNLPVENILVAVSVVADDCMTADAWATALMVMGEEAGPEFARAHQLSAIFFLKNGPETAVIETGVFADHGLE